MQAMIKEHSGILLSEKLDKQKKPEWELIHGEASFKHEFN